MTPLAKEKEEDYTSSLIHCVAITKSIFHSTTVKSPALGRIIQKHMLAFLDYL